MLCSNSSGLMTSSQCFQAAEDDRNRENYMDVS